MEQGWEDFYRQLDASVFFLLVILAGMFFSFRALLLQKEQLCEIQAGEDSAASETENAVRKLRGRSLALITGSLGFFLMLSQRNLEQARTTGDDASANRNVWAALLTLAAALIRLYDHCIRERERNMLFSDEEVVSS